MEERIEAGFVRKGYTKSKGCNARSLELRDAKIMCMDKDKYKGLCDCRRYDQKYFLRSKKKE